MREDQKTNQDVALGANIVVGDGAGAVNGASVDMSKYRNAQFSLTLLNKNIDGTVTMKLQHSDDDTTFTDDDGSTGNDTALADVLDADEAIDTLCVVRPIGRYYRAVATVATSGVDASLVNIAGPKYRIDPEA